MSETKSDKQIIREYLFGLYKKSLEAKSTSTHGYFVTPEGFQEFIDNYNKYQSIESALKLQKLVNDSITQKTHLDKKFVSYESWNLLKYLKEESEK